MPLGTIRPAFVECLGKKLGEAHAVLRDMATIVITLEYTQTQVFNGKAIMRSSIRLRVACPTS